VTKDQARKKPIGPVTKADIEAKLRELGGGLEDDADRGRRVGPWVLGAAVVIVVVYRLGVSLGARNSTLLEIRRIPGAS
jgi:hypothetical protein